MKLHFRQALPTDLNRLIEMLAADPLGATREDSSQSINKKYVATFKAIDKDPNNELVVLENCGEVIGMLQLTFIPYLTYIGAWRCLIEGVRIDEKYRGLGLGEKLFKYAIEKAQNKGCKLIQLTSDKARPDAIRFYQKLGFVASHEGLKLHL